MTDNRAVFTRFEDRFVLMHIVGNSAQAVYVYDDLDTVDPGTVINCRVSENMTNIDASFIRFSKEGTGFINKKIKCETILPLMLKIEAYDDKKAAFTDRIVIEGEYVVVQKPGDHVKASGKIEDAKKKKLIEELGTDAKKAGVGIVIRTKTGQDPSGIIKARDELSKIIRIFDSISERSSHTPQYTVLYRPFPAPVKNVLELVAEGIEEVVTDIHEIFDFLSASYDHISGPVSITDRVSLRLYEDKMIDLCHLYSFNAKISEALSHKVYLKSGAYITFDTTEALTAVDVNSASFDRKNDKEDAFLTINNEAAREIARQIRIRNISGMIIIDFINMRSSESYSILEKTVRDALAKDNGSRFVDFTGLGLCEITRSRKGRSLYSCLRER